MTSSPQAIPFDRESHLDGSASDMPPLAAMARLPEGTPITIRLRNPVSSAFSHAGDSFQGTLDDPIVLNGQTVVARGANVTGRVLAARTAGHVDHPGYLRLAVVSVMIDGKPLPISTSSLFVKGAAHDKRDRTPGSGTTAAFLSDKSEISFAAERRLTFRLAQALEFP